METNKIRVGIFQFKKNDVIGEINIFWQMKNAEHPQAQDRLVLSILTIQYVLLIQYMESSIINEKLAISLLHF